MTNKWLILDAMGVIFELGRDLYELLIPFVWSKNIEISDNLMIEIYLKASKGLIKSSEIWNQLGFGDKYPQIEKEYLDTQLIIDPEFLELMSDFKKEYSMALLSNDVKEWSHYLRQKFGLNDIFNEVIISGEVGLRKPDEKIYKLLLERINAPPSNCVFVDDNLNNLRSASRLGIKTIRFVRSRSKTPFCSEFEISSFKELLGVLKNFY